MLNRLRVSHGNDPHGDSNGAWSGAGRCAGVWTGFVVFVLFAYVPVAQSAAGDDDPPPADSGAVADAAGADAAGADAAGAETASEPVLDGREGRNLALDAFRPEPKLRVKRHHVPRAKFPCVDVHTHPFYRLRGSSERLAEVVRMMDEHNIAVCVSLDGGLGLRLEEHIEYLWSDYRQRFVIFGNLDWRGGGKEDDPATWDCQRPDFARRMVRQLTEAKKLGISGLKLFKSFGLRYRNADGSLIEIDDPRWDPIWQACGKLGLVVLIHTADPAAFFDPIDETNERWEELHRHPDWSFHGPEFPSREALLDARNRVIGAHVANNSEDLEVVAQWLEKYPNLYVDPASRIGELGRQPYTARKFFIKYADRILFGSDGPWPAARMHRYWQFLESFDEWFPYSEKEFPPQGLWNIFGIGLPDEVLRKVYYENAARVIPGVGPRVEALMKATPKDDSQSTTESESSADVQPTTDTQPSAEP
jgi:predicted TIM-barrel fold metal-dependent hydrolase